MVNLSTINLIQTLSNHISITRIVDILDISQSAYYRHLNKNNQYTLTDIERQIHQFCIETYFLYGYRKIQALLLRNSDIQYNVSKVQRIMSQHGWKCHFR